MKDGKCSKYFPKRFNSGTVIDDDGCPIYKRRDYGSIVEKNGILLDNRFVVPYNPLLLIKYQAHINVEWCNQSRSIKYLFKYVNKGHDRVTAAFYQSTSESEHLQDEIKMYYDCRYVSPCEAVWRIFGFDINYREPPVERLSFHLQNEQTVVFDDDEPIDSILKDDELKILTLAEIDKLLRSNGKSLAEFPPMPLPNKDLLFGARNKLLQDELCYDRNSMTREHKTLMSSLTDEQKGVYETIISAVSKNDGSVFFLYGYGGTGKTFIWRTLSAAIRSKGQIVLNVASSGIASLLLPGGRSAHSRFGIPLAITEKSTCNIKQGSDLAELLIHTKLIIWDEAPMAHRFCFEALDRTLRDILRFSNPSSCEQPFGGKVVVFGGDFRQILPVIPKGTRQDIIFARNDSVLTLTKNMRLETGSSNYNLEEMREFSKWILSVGDGDAGEENDGEEIIEIPDEFLIKE
uniref:ATP-dependent DNA helicase n=1 Tax=Ananas comosus var. bracteatus TaxID=296719 RepID=A0A6V7PRK8_ANACO|nr:unnamed protein product [Ananas comosus var. bracteatus]